MRWLILVCLAVLCSVQVQAGIARRDYRMRHIFLKSRSCREEDGAEYCSLRYSLPANCIPKEHDIVCMERVRTGEGGFTTLSKRRLRKGSRISQSSKKIQSSKKGSPPKKSDKKAG
ncbi:hypothetical protein GCK32_010244 [Trichostrongylus colubriformis]|uniref:Secreted protein n=1 Tax=Trichostrongylus colubriformis TaxID=6319 RepID=A0AAN8FNQ3_TRICO